MSMERLERAFSLLIAVLMVTTAFIPAVSATEPHRAASSVNTATDLFSGTTTSASDTSGASLGTASYGNGNTRTEKDLLLSSGDSRSQPPSWTNTPADIEQTRGPGSGVSPASGTKHVVTGSGKTKIKIYDRESRTIRIKDDSRSAATGGDDELEIRLVNATPDLGTFTEFFEITAHRTIALDGSEDFLATWALCNGNENATQVEWFVWEERSHSIEIPIIEYREVTLENVTPEDTTLEGVTLDGATPIDITLESVNPESTTPVSVILETVSPEDVTLESVIQEDVIPEENFTQEDGNPEDAAFETFIVREPYIAGTETVEQSWPEWVPFVPDGQTLNAGETRLFKVVYTKPAELGQVDINTAPVFRGVACPEMTWWSTTWAYRVPVTVTNPPSIDGYPHREVVSYLPGMQRDFDDVRFVTDGGVVLDYWKEGYTTGNSAVIWVNLPTGTTSIWMYYGNAAATDIGSRDNAYILYDDFNGFNRALWTRSQSDSLYVQGGWIRDEQSRELSRRPGVLVSNNPVIIEGESVIVEMRIFVINVSRYTACGYFPQFIENSHNGLLWYPGNQRQVVKGGVTSWQPGLYRGLVPGAIYLNTWIITPSSQTHTVGGSVSYSDVFQGTTGISYHRMWLFGGDNSVAGRSMRMDWIRVRKYVETEPALTYGTPQTCPIVTITSPGDDTVGAGGNVTVAGTISSSAVSSLTLTHNTASSIVPVQDGIFSAEVTLADANTITINGTDSFGNTFSVTLLLDGDMLPGTYEQAIGFDPLDADSDCSSPEDLAGDQSGNGVIDSYEVFAGDLPVFAKYRIGADPFAVDTDGDGLTDSFELLKLGTFPEEDDPIQVIIHSTEGDYSVAVAVGTDDDPDGDGLSNLDEQNNGTDPLSADSDDDGLSDADEVLIWTTDPCDADSDDDGLTDGAEVALGTDPNNPDGVEDYWSSDRFLDETLNLTVFGRGYAIANVSVAAVNYTHLISDEVLVSKVCNIGFGDDIESGTIEIAYDPTHVENASRLAIYRFDEDLGTFVNVSSTVDAANGVVSCAAAGSAKYAVLDSARWDALFAGEVVVEALGDDYPYSARLCVRDSQTGEGVGDAKVTFFSVESGGQDLVTNTTLTGDTKGLTLTCALYPTGGAHPYLVEKNGYDDHYGMICFEGDSTSVTTISEINSVNAPTGSLTVTSTPSAGVVYYIDNIYYGGSGVSNVKLLEGEHTLVLTTPSTYYGTAIEKVWITRNQHTLKHINLPPTSGCGNVRVICSEPGAAVSIDGFGVGVIPASRVLTRADVPSGARNVTVTKEGFAPYSEDVTIVSGQTSTVNAVLVPEDLDEDGLPDIKETGGYRDGYGRWHYSDPNAVDTDGDGLSDGYESGFSFTVGGKTYHKSRSDPTKVDTDDDELDDYMEDYLRTDPNDPDTDHDLIRDGGRRRSSCPYVLPVCNGSDS